MSEIFTCDILLGFQVAEAARMWRCEMGREAMVAEASRGRGGTREDPQLPVDASFQHSGRTQEGLLTARCPRLEPSG